MTVAGCRTVAPRVGFVQGVACPGDATRLPVHSPWRARGASQHGPGPHKDWVGCRGSEERYGGYPCGLWSVWHALTVNQANLNQGDPKEVLLAMKVLAKFCTEKQQS